MGRKRSGARLRHTPVAPLPSPAGEPRRRRQLVIGCGNAACGDDAAGLVAVEALAGKTPDGVEVRTLEGDLTRLVGMWDDFDRVILLDAMLSGAPPYTVRRFDGRTLQGTEGLRPLSSHAFDLGAAIRLGRAIGHCPEEILVIGIEARRFDPATPASPTVVRAARRAARAALSALRDPRTIPAPL